MEKDTKKWEQRYENFAKALQKLTQAVEYIRQNIGSGHNETESTWYIRDEILKDGLIYRFKFTHEMASNTIRDFAEAHGSYGIKGSKDATREALKYKLIDNGEVWIDMVMSRTNAYSADEIYSRIMTDYYPAFTYLAKNLESAMSR